MYLACQNCLSDKSKRYNFQSLGKEQGGLEKEKGEAFNISKRARVALEDFPEVLSLSLSHELGALSLSWSS
jgi:hypothetical protein